MASNCPIQYSYEDLPMEIILRILDYLPSSSDLCSASLTCRRWFDAAQGTKLAKNVYINFCERIVNVRAIKLRKLKPFQRNYSRVVFNDVNIGHFNNKFWQYLSTSRINEISFEKCHRMGYNIHNTFKGFNHLRVLEIKYCSKSFMIDYLLDATSSERYYLSNTFGNIETLILEDLNISDSILNQFFELMPKLCEISFELCNKMYFETDIYGNDLSIQEIEPLNNLLTFQFVLQLLRQRAKLIKKLNFSRTTINDSALKSMGKLNDLKLSSLKLNYCFHTGNFIFISNKEIINFIYTQQSLNVLELTRSNVTDELLIIIAKILLQLNVLKIGDCSDVTDIGIKAVATMKHLTILDISRCKLLTSNCITHGIAKSKNKKLIELHASDLDICEIAIMYIAINLPNLRVLDLSFCHRGVTDVALQLIFKYLPWLRTLNLFRCRLISDFGITGVNMDNQMKKMEYLFENTTSTLNTINDQPRHRQQDFVTAAKFKEHMFNLYDSGNAAQLLTANASGYSLNNLKGLHKLHLEDSNSDCNKISDYSFKHSFKLSELKELHLNSCPEISTVGFQYLLKNCPSLKICNFSRCNNITDESIELLTKKLNFLTHLTAIYVYKLTENSIDSVVNNCKVLKSLSLGYKSNTEPNEKLNSLTSLRGCYCFVYKDWCANI